MRAGIPSMQRALEHAASAYTEISVLPQDQQARTQSSASFTRPQRNSRGFSSDPVGEVAPFRQEDMCKKMVLEVRTEAPREPPEPAASRGGHPQARRLKEMLVEKQNETIAMDSHAVLVVSVHQLLFCAAVPHDSTRIEATPKCEFRRGLTPSQRSETQLNIRFLADFSEDDAVQAGEVPEVPEELCCVQERPSLH